ncbi:Coiled-coil domain-containing protein 22 like [Pseudolycoriella hygida]|uniref:Coiled-coil domain-containing protein 22 homolog n=1 Tax=Pseudolycoriella hygida TaxID=35572 RepID=A0A9Q0NEB7_9DIPT|nr:Coiled-coil domain-containing protein 22 like [Pseudolycoriella hygida]
MEEIEEMIIHSLRQIGCDIDDTITNLSDFSPEKIFETVSKCLLSIKSTLELPSSLPPSMAQRFGVATKLSEACVSIGFRGDIGYQTFLYSNIIELRRVFMFLIERLPKESEKLPLAQPTDKLSLIEQDIARNIGIQLNASWTPQYCKKNGITKLGNVVVVQNHPFLPQNLNIPFVSKQNVVQKLREYWKRSPTVFQQTQSMNLCASLVHKNDIDRLDEHSKSFDKLLNALGKQPTIGVRTTSKDHLRNIKSVQQLTLNNVEIKNQNDIVAMPEISPVDALNFDINKLKESIEQCVLNRKTLMSRMNDVKELKAKEEESVLKLKEQRKIAERTHILLENPEVNITKMGAVLEATKERMNHLKEQWNERRIPLMEQLEQTQQSTSKQYSQTRHIMDQIKSTREKADEVSEDLKNKISVHVQLASELEKLNNNISRNAYTSRIMEIIGNIKKQKDDIDKVLNDTRLLQKEINNITGQLDRQFAVTDDLMFTNAKRDEHSKRAYKLLATLHGDCSDLIALVRETGALMREVRDVEDQIENEKNRNISSNLERITADLKLVETEGKDLQEKIKKASDMRTNK